MKKRLLGFGVATALVLAGCTDEEVEKKPVENVQEATEDVVTATSSVEKEGNVNEQKKLVTVTDKLLIKEDNGMKLDITVPEIEGLNGFNQEALKLGRDLEKDVRESEDAIPGGSQMGDIPLHAEGEMDYSVKLVNSKTVSVLVNGYSYAGGAHGSPYKVPLNYDLKTGSPLQLADLFEGEGYLGEVSGLVAKSIENDEIVEMFFEPFTEIKENPKFYLTPENLVIVFDQYEYTAGAVGVPEIVLAKSELKSLKNSYR